VNVCVFCSSSDGIDPVYFQAAVELGHLLAARAHTLVYGGASIGLMGTVARAVHNAKGHVIGVIPQSLVARELTYREAGEVVVTADLRERKRVMEERSDAFVALPGGFGTLEETIELLTLKQLGLHAKPIVIVNVAGFYDPLLHLFAHIAQNGFAPLGGNTLYTVVDTVAAAIDAVEEESAATRDTATTTPS
jgi:cytokinin riboside 5'-monophosphate phosphoribohydrolase